MKIRHFWPFAFGVIFIVSINSCTKTVVQTNVDSLTIVDSIRDTLGLGLVRFVSMFPQGASSFINIYEGKDTVGIPLTVASNSCPNSYIPVSPNISTNFYAYVPVLNGNQFMPLAAPRHTMNTVAMFLSTNSQDSNFNYVVNTDSEKFTPPPPGYCYIRLINGIADAVLPFYVDLDTVGQSIFYSGSVPQSIPPFSFSYYALIPAGQHTIFLRTEDSFHPRQVAYQFSQQCEDGGYYTIEAIGPMANKIIGIDKE